MAVKPGPQRPGPEQGRLILRTPRDGLGARAGHDPVIEVARWPGELAAGEDLTPAGLQVRQAAPGRYRPTGLVVQPESGIKPYAAFMGALRVRDAVGVEADAALDGEEPGP